eukprot:8833334-Heterocapsa_arctica.AAC.1
MESNVLSCNVMQRNATQRNAMQCNAACMDVWMDGWMDGWTDRFIDCAGLPSHACVGPRFCIRTQGAYPSPRGRTL